MKRILISSITFLVLFAQTLFAQNSIILKEVFEENTVGYFDVAEVSISFYDKTMYYPVSVQNNPIYVHVSIANKGPNTLRFKLADEREFSLDFNAFNMKNEKLPQTDSLIRTRTTSQSVYFREIVLGPEEEYGFIVNLKDYLAIANPSIYYFEVTFYPELYKTRYPAIVSNRLGLEISPDPTIGASVFVPINFETSALLIPENLSPDQVIEQTIIARQRSLWDQFFLYMDVEALFKKDDLNNRQYNAASEQERQIMLINFKSTLSSSMFETDISAIPQQFQIEKTTYTQTEGTVTVLQWFAYPTFIEKKRYTYYLRLRDGIWQIYDYTVDNLGTE